MIKISRHDRILGRLAQSGEVSVCELAEHLGVSSMTIRRDLDELAGRGELSRTHGGAVFSRTGSAEFTFREKANDRLPEKRAIAAAVAAMVEPGMAVSLDTGTTTLEVARRIAGVRDLTVLTSSLAIASVLHTRENIQLVLLGGTVRSSSPDLSGPLTEENLRHFRAHLAVLGADAVDFDATFTTDVGVARISRAMAEHADRAVVAADSSKFTKTSFVRCLPLAEVDSLVTDDGCPPDVRTRLERAVKNVIYAKVDRGG